MALTVVLLHAFSTLAMVGLIWFVQIVHYPLFACLEGRGFRTYHGEHTRRTGWVVGPPMLVEVLSAGVLSVQAWTGSIPIPLPLVLVAGGLLAVVWGSTAFLQVPDHGRLAGGGDAGVIRRLVTTNWIRTVAWTLRGGLALWFVVLVARAPAGGA